LGTNCMWFNAIIKRIYPVRISRWLMCESPCRSDSCNSRVVGPKVGSDERSCEKKWEVRRRIPYSRGRPTPPALSGMRHPIFSVHVPPLLPLTLAIPEPSSQSSVLQLRLLSCPRGSRIQRFRLGSTLAHLWVLICFQNRAKHSSLLTCV
jgi:hypothetical protein